MDPVKGISALTLLSLGLIAPVSGKEPVKNIQHKKSNVLFVIVDDLRPELGCYGNTVVLSPNIDKLAKEGVVFTRAYCNVPVCGASRASLLTGTRPTDYRFLNYLSRADKDNSSAVTAPGYFRKNGYYTVSLSKVFHFQDDSREVWDEIWAPSSRNGSPRNYQLPENIAKDSGLKMGGMPYEMADVPDSTYFDGEIALKATNYLRRFAKAGQPFFLAVGFKKPHLPFNAPVKYWDMYDPKRIGLAPNPLQPENAPSQAFHPWKELRSYYSVPKEGPLSDDMALKLRHAYYACVSYVDAQIGLLIQELKNTGLDRNTIVVLCGDHGWNLGENALWGKHCNFNWSLNAPLIFKSPGINKGKKSNAITEFIDIYPTLCELCGLKKPSHLDGESLVNRLKKPGKKEDDYAVCKWDNGLTYIEGNDFYTEWYDKNDHIITNMLYDHTIDPDENTNLSVKPEYAQKVEELSKKLRSKRGNNFFK